VRVWVDREYLEGLQVRGVTPEPEGVRAGSDGLTYVFENGAGGRPATVTFDDVQPQGVGPLEGRVGLEGEEPVGFRQFVCP